MAERLVIQTLSTLGRSNIDKENFLIEITNQQIEYLRTPVQEIHVVTSISINNKFPLYPIEYDGMELRFYQRLPKKYKRDIFLENVKNILHNPKFPTDYKYVVIKVKARAGDEAAIKALDNLDFILGTWNLSLNYRQGRLIYFEANKQEPINQIVKGPIHTLHQNDGSPLSQNLYYYETDYYRPTDSCFPAAFQRIRVFETRVKKRVKLNLKWGARIRNAVIRYTRALEKNVHTNSFLELWTILEDLTSTTFKENYEVTIRRVGSLYEETELYRGFVNYIRHIRNNLVHKSEFNVHRTNITYELKGYVENLILYHITAIRTVNNFNEAIQYLDFPNDERAIRKRIRLMKLYYKNRFGRNT
jgi:hypothetical protein